MAATNDAQASDTEVDSDNEDDDYYWARLVPLNAVARQAFSDTVSALDAQHPEAHRLHQFIRRDKTPKGDLPVTGHYIFDLRILPRNVDSGWVLGSNSSAVDMLLVPNPTSHVGGTHCQVTLASNANALVIRAGMGKEVVVGGNRIVGSTIPHLLTSGCGVAIGSLHYTFQLHRQLRSEPQRFAKQLEEYRKERGWEKPSVPAALAPTPNANVINVQGFAIEQPTAHGAFGNVSFGYCLEGARVVAAKRLPLTSSKSRKSVGNEIMMLKTFQHENIVRMADNFHAPSARELQHMTEVTLVIEPAMSCSLLEVIDQNPLNLAVEDKIRIAQDVFAGLAHLHAEGYLHRDVKPGNVGFARRSKAVLLDLGLCMYGSSCDSWAGSIPYSAPEALDVKHKRTGSYGPAADVWSAGLTLAELVFDRKFVEDHYRPETTRRQHQETVNRLVKAQWSSMEADFWKIVQQAIAWEPDRRPTSHTLHDSFRRLTLVRKAPPED